MSSQSDWDPGNWKPQPIYQIASAVPDSGSGRQRGFWLTAWIIASGLLSALVLFLLLDVRSNSPAIPILFFLSTANLICLGGMWRWKKWGVYGAAAIMIASPFFEAMFSRLAISDCIAPFVQVGILYLLVMNRWSDFD